MNTTFIDLVINRASVRSYSDRPVEKKTIIKCLEAARLAPSACNSQPWKFIVIDNPDLKDRVAKLTSGGVLPLNHFTKQAPVLVAVVMEQPNLTSSFGSKVKGKHFPLIDIGIAAEHFCLAAAEEELGTCILGWFDEKEVSRILNIPSSSRPVLVITLGYPAVKTAAPKKRKTISEISSWNSYS